MATDSHKVLLVGLGQIGMGYDLQLEDDAVYSHARAFSRVPGFTLAAGVDGSAEQRARFTQHYGAPAYATVAEALAAHGTPGVLAVAVPTAHHGAVLREVLAHGSPRAVLCEKPLADDIAEARAMEALCRERGVALYVNYIRRSDSAVAEVARRIAGGAIAGPLKGVCWYSKGLRHNGSHFFNLLEYWLGPLRSATVLDAGRLWQGHDPEPDVRAVFERGSVMLLAAREEAFSHYTIELLAANGRLRYEQGGQQVSWQPAVPGALAGYTVLSPQAENLPTGMRRYQLHVAEQLAAALRGEAHVLCSGAEGLATLEHLQPIIEQCTRT